MRAAGLLQAAVLAAVSVVAAAHCGGDTKGDGPSAKTSADGSTDSTVDETSVTDVKAADASDDSSSVDATTPDAPPPTCQPGQSEPCYQGPAWTNGVGACHSGKRTCGTDGIYGACAGQVLPQDETCASPFDDDCDGLVNEDGPDCGCGPGAEIPCYAGPSQTLGVGPCKAGAQACLATGLGYGPCKGSVVPSAESCATPTDEDCDAEPECPGDAQWAQAYDYFWLTHAARGGGSKLNLLTYMPLAWWEVDAAGYSSLVQTYISNVYTEHGPHVLGGDPSGATELVVGTYDKVSPWAPLLPPDVSGVFVMLRNGWQRAFAAQGNGVGVTHVSMHPADTPPGWYLGGALNGSLQAKPGASISGTGDPFVMKVTAASGEATFARRIFEAIPAFVPQLSGVQSTGQGVALVGTFSSSVSLDGTLLKSKGDKDVFLAVMNGNGKTTAAYSFGGANEDTVTLVGRAGTAPIVVAGTAYAMTIGTVEFSSGVYLLRFSDALEPVSALKLPSCTFLYAAALDEATEDAYLVLYCGTATDFGGGTLPAGAVLLSVDKNNQHRFSRPLPKGANVEHLFAFDGALHLAGTFEGSPDFGTGPIVTKYPSTPNKTQVFVVRMTK